jgi:uncharacterized membrane protein (Fun14 family)
MQKDDVLFKKIKNASILSGIGMGLLLGLIMGLSVSEVVKVIMGAMTALLGTFLGFDKRNFSGVSAEDYSKEKENTLFTSLRAGWFGFAVVAGILSGMFIRTHEVFTPSVEKSIKQWTDAGYDAAYARKLVTFQRLAINPGTGAVEPITSITRSISSNLFSAEQVASLCNNMDPYVWKNNWAVAKEHMDSLHIPQLSLLAISIETNIKDNDQKFRLLNTLSPVFCKMQGNTIGLCKLGTGFEAWENNAVTKKVAAEIAGLPADKRQALLLNLSALVCSIEAK